MRVLRLMILIVGMLGGAIGLSAAVAAAPMPVAGLVGQASDAPLVAQARWHYRRRFYRPRYRFRRFYHRPRYFYRPRFYRPRYYRPRRFYRPRYYRPRYYRPRYFYRPRYYHRRRFFF